MTPATENKIEDYLTSHYLHITHHIVNEVDLNDLLHTHDYTHNEPDYTFLAIENEDGDILCQGSAETIIDYLKSIITQ